MATPMTAAQFVAALRAEGVVVKTPHSGWTTHERDEATGKAFGPVHGVVIHHTAAHGDYEVVYTGNSALPGPRAHGYINKAGEVLMCSAGRANHAGGGDPDVLQAVISESYASRPPHTRYGEGDPGAADGNDPFYGYECENLGDGKDPWPRVQYAAMVKAAAAICRHYGWSEKSVIGHLEWSNQKIDPRGFDMINFRADVKACLAQPAGRWSATKEDSSMALTDADIEKIFDADLIPAQTTPYNNPDFATNKTWTVHYTLYAAVRAGREANARLKGLQGDVAAVRAKVDALTVGGIDLDALAAKVADVLAARLKQ